MPVHTTLKEAMILLLQESGSRNQEDVCHALSAQGFDVNQSKVSRMLRKLGAIKIKNPEGQLVYTLPRDPAPPTSDSSLSQLILEITANESLIIVYTSPGSASLIARLIDHHRERLHILGTVAGDDTIFIAPVSTKNITQTIDNIRHLLPELS